MVVNNLILSLIIILISGYLTYSQVNVITIDDKGNIGGLNYQNHKKINIQNKSQIVIINVDESSAIIEVINKNNKFINLNLYYFNNNVSIPFGSLKIKNYEENLIPRLKQTIEIPLSVLKIYQPPIINFGQSSPIYVKSLFQNKVLLSNPSSIFLYSEDSLKLLIEGHIKFKNNLSVSSPRFYNNGNKIAYLSGDENSSKRYIKFFNLKNSQSIGQFEVSDETINIHISNSGKEMLLYQYYDRNNSMYKIHHLNLITEKDSLIGIYKGAFFME